MSLPPSQRGLPRHTGVPRTQTGRNAGTENLRQKRPAQNKSEPAYPTDHRLTTRACLDVAYTGANRKRIIFFVKHVRHRETAIVVTVELCRSKEITTTRLR